MTNDKLSDLQYAETVDCSSCGRKAGERCRGMNGNLPPVDRGPHLPRIILGRRYRELRAQQTRGKE